MDIFSLRAPAIEAYAYLDDLPRGFGFDREPGYACLRLGRVVVEVEHISATRKAR